VFDVSVPWEESRQNQAEGAGFEPATSYPVPVFKTGAINQAPPPLRALGRRCRRV
jgi:hypothetical protein